MKITVPRLIALARGKEQNEVGFAGGYIQPHLIATITHDVVVALEFEPNEFGQENPPLEPDQYRFTTGSVDWRWLIAESDRLGLPISVLPSRERPESYSRREYLTLTLRVGDAMSKLYCYDELVSHG